MSFIDKYPHLLNANGKDMKEEIKSFADHIGLNTIAPNRYSIILLVELFGGFKSGGLHIEKIMHEIRILEDDEIQSQLKKPTQFTRPPLKGLWHKHYFEGGMNALLINLGMLTWDLKPNKNFSIPLFEQRIKEAEQGGRQEISIDDSDAYEQIQLLVDDMVSGNWSRRTAAKALTGEWIVYAKYENQNYYLCLGKHQSTEDNGIRKNDDENIRQRVDYCIHQFPFLEGILV
jgi:hypothetical protein